MDWLPRSPKNEKIIVRCSKEFKELFIKSFLEFKKEHRNATYEDFLRYLILGRKIKLV
jgi:hypothetical protein